MNLPALLLAALVTALLLLVEVAYLWRWAIARREYDRYQPYIVGVATVLGPYGVYCWLTGDLDAFAAICVLFAGGGLATAAGYELQRRRHAVEEDDVRS